MQTFADIERKLPKYRNEVGEAKKWWTNKIGYSSSNNESTKSSKELFLRRKVHGANRKPEAIVIADFSNDPPPADSFKAVHVSKPPKPTG